MAKLIRGFLQFLVGNVAENDNQFTAVGGLVYYEASNLFAVKRG
jgi:hypothetical protein